jgi:hypothetical protein
MNMYVYHPTTSDLCTHPEIEWFMQERFASIARRAGERTCNAENYKKPTICGPFPARKVE